MISEDIRFPTRAGMNYIGETQVSKSAAWLPWLGGVISLLLLAVASFAIHHELKTYHYHDILRHLSEIPRPQLLLAVVLTAVNYLALTGYDTLAFRHIHRVLAYPKIALTSFISYVFSYNVGLSVFGGTAIRYRFYSSWGISAEDVARISAFCTLTLWLGFFATAGVIFLFQPLQLHTRIAFLESVRPLGALFVFLIGFYFLWGSLGGKILKIKSWRFDVPSPRLSLAQLAVSCVDWVIAASVLYVLLPPSIPFRSFLAVFLLGQFAGLISHVPGGLGVFETTILYFLSPYLPAPSILGSLVAYRAIYYFGPLIIAVSFLGLSEFWRKRAQAQKAAEFFNQHISGFLPQVFALSIFIAGMILLYSGSTPTVAGRLAWLRAAVPLPIIEISHFIGSLTGVALVVLAWGLYRRLDAAYYLTLGFLAAGTVLSLLKGLDYEEATILTVMFLALFPCHRHFHRKTTLLQERFTGGWTLAIAGVILSALWLGFFSFKHVEYSHDLWWRFEFSGDASRSLRALVGSVGALFLFGLVRLFAPARPKMDKSTKAMDRILPLVLRSSSTSANLALLGDKTFLLNDSGKAFLMYGVSGRSWVVMGDPIGDESEFPGLLFKFREMTDIYRGWPVFYEVSRERLYLYLDMGLMAFKLGEEAFVPLQTFSLEGSSRKGLRHTYNKASKEGMAFRIASTEEVPALLSQLKQISDSWLAEKNTREKGFSLGAFDEIYLAHFPVALLEREGKILAFANLWTTGTKAELSIDLMRHLPEAPRSVMEYLFICLMLWGKEQGYQRFSLGMAPFSGLEAHVLAPLWAKLGAFLFRHGEHFYNFRGLREYKDKFDPVWEPKYLAGPRGLALPAILANTASLISGGLRGVISK